MQTLVVFVVLMISPDGTRIDMQHEIVTERVCQDRVAHSDLIARSGRQAFCVTPDAPLSLQFRKEGAPS